MSKYQKDEEISMIEKTGRDCIECDRCKKNCSFLQKNDMNLLGFCNKTETAYSCFLCDKCKAVCPVDLSGAKIAIEHRKKTPEKAIKTAFMKNSYKFRNNSKKKTNDLLFLGCNYPGFYPKTCEKLIEIFKAEGFDYSVDCCKKPVYEMGGTANIENIEKLCATKNVQRLVTCCPNCYYFMKDRISVKVIDIYEWMIEKGIGKKIDGKLDIFFPCSDKETKEIFESLKYFIEDYSDTFTDVNCCGLGGGVNDKELLNIKKDRIIAHNVPHIYTYCSSCSGIFKNGYKINGIKNILSEILDVNEEVSTEYPKNVMKFMFKNLRK